MAARFSDNPAKGFLRMSVIVNQPAIRFPFFPRIQLFALDILDDRNF